MIQETETPRSLAVIAGYALFVFLADRPSGGMADFKGIFKSRERAREEFCEQCKNRPDGSQVRGHVTDMTQQGTECLFWHNTQTQTGGATPPPKGTPMTDQNKTPAEPSAPALSVVAGSGLTMTITASQPRFRCPTCKHESGGGIEDACAISVSIEPHSGKYCLKCYAAWIAANVPKLEEIFRPNVPDQPRP